MLCPLSTHSHTYYISLACPLYLYLALLPSRSLALSLSLSLSLCSAPQGLQLSSHTLQDSQILNSQGPGGISTGLRYRFLLDYRL